MLDERVRADAMGAHGAARLAVEPVRVQRRGAVRAAARLSSTRRSSERLRTFLERLENVPAYYAAAKANIENPTREHTRLAIEQNRGALAVFGRELEQQIAGSKLSSRGARVVQARGSGRARERSRTTSRGSRRSTRKLASGAVQARSFRLGRELYAQKFALDIQSGDTAEALYARALAEKESAARPHGAARATLLWPKYFPNAAPPDDRLEHDRPR